jgi:hypothetical protein
MASESPRQTRQLRYRFKRKNGETREFTVDLQLPELVIVPPRGAPMEDWTRLDHCQCTHCPLPSAPHAHCPVALNLAPVIAVFKDCLSHEAAEVEVLTETRAYTKTVDLQTGISALMGLIMVTSGCPVMDKLRPMGATHLPFATVDETLFRSVSTYLLAQYLRARRGESADWELRNFASIYEAVGELNRCFKKRLESIIMKDANLNALTQLDCFGMFSALGLEDGSLDGLEPMFASHLKEDHGDPTPR